jgi:hypothetical protein
MKKAINFFLVGDFAAMHDRSRSERVFNKMGEIVENKTNDYD